MKTDEKKKNHARSTTYEVCSIFLWSTAGETYEVLGVHTMYVRIYHYLYTVYTIYNTIYCTYRRPIRCD